MSSHSAPFQRPRQQQIEESAVPGDDHQVRAQAEQSRFMLHRAHGREEAFASGLVVPPVRELSGQPPARPFAPHSFHDRPASLVHLGLQFFGMVEERGGETARVNIRIAVLPVPQVLLDDADEGGGIEEAGGDPVEQGGEAADAHRKDQTAATHDPSRFPQGAEPVGAIRQVIERSHQQDGINAHRRAFKMTSITDVDTGERATAGIYE